MSKSHPVTLNSITWGQFLDLVELRGVSIEETKTPIREGGPRGKYLLRKFDGQEFTCGLPSNFSRENRMGPWVCESVCNRLGIPLRALGLAIIL